MPNEIGIPNRSSIMNAARGYAYGAVGGLAYQLISGFLGNNTLLGSIGTAVLAGGFLKEEGKTLCTILGFQAIQSGALNIGSLGGKSAAADEGTI